MQPIVLAYLTLIAAEYADVLIVTDGFMVSEYNTRYCRFVVGSLEHWF